MPDPKESARSWLDVVAGWRGATRVVGDPPPALRAALDTCVLETSEASAARVLLIPTCVDSSTLPTDADALLTSMDDAGELVVLLPWPFAMTADTVIGPAEATALLAWAGNRALESNVRSYAALGSQCITIRRASARPSPSQGATKLDSLADAGNAGSLTAAEVIDVSAIVVTHGRRPSLLRQAIESMLAQSRAPRELIVVEDGRSNQTRALVASFGSRVRLLEATTDAPEGQAAAMTRGLRASAGAWIAWLDDDDLWAPRKLEHQWAARSDGVDLIATTYAILNEAGETQAIAPRPPLDRFPALRLLLHGSIVTGPSLLVRRSLYERVGPYDASFARLADYEFLSRALSETTIELLDLPLTWVRRHAGNRRGPEVEAAIRDSATRVLRRLRADVPLERMFPEIEVLGDIARMRALLERGGACLRQELRREAEEDFHAALDHASSPLEPELALGALYLRESRLDEAEAHFARARNVALRNPRPLLGLGLVAAARQRWQEAEASFSAAIELDPLNPVARSNLILHRFRVPGLESPLTIEVEALVRDLLGRLRPPDLSLSLLEVDDPSAARPFGLL